MNTSSSSDECNDSWQAGHIVRFECPIYRQGIRHSLYTSAHWAREEVLDAKREWTILCCTGREKRYHSLLKLIKGNCVRLFAFCLMWNKRPARWIVNTTHLVESETNHINVCTAETEGSVAVHPSFHAAHSIQCTMRRRNIKMYHSQHVLDVIAKHVWLVCINTILIPRIVVSLQMNFERPGFIPLIWLSNRLGHLSTDG
jgi:hypothetical protein